MDDFSLGMLFLVLGGALLLLAALQGAETGVRRYGPAAVPADRDRRAPRRDPDGTS